MGIMGIFLIFWVMQDLYIINRKAHDEGSQGCFKSFRAWLQDEGPEA